MCDVWKYVQKLSGLSVCVCVCVSPWEKGHHLKKMLKYSGERVYVYINIFRQAAAGGGRSKTLVCIVCVSAPLAPCRVITWGNLLPNQHWHTQRQSTPPPPPPPHLYPPFLSLSSGASQLILHHFIFLFYRDGKWLTVIFEHFQFMLFGTVIDWVLLLAHLARMLKN